MTIYRTTIANLISRGNLSRYLIKVLTAKDCGDPIVSLKIFDIKKRKDSSIVEITQSDLARMLVLRDLFESLRVSRKALADVYRQLASAFLKHSQSMDLQISKRLYLRIEVARYLAEAKEILTAPMEF